MSINWVMLEGPQNFVRLPREKILFTSPTRTSLALTTPNTYPGKEPLSLKSSDGRAIITNQRLIYLPTPLTPTLQSLSAPLLNLHDTHVTAPFFGPNAWEAALVPVPNGGIPAHHSLVSLKLTFKDGGAFDFHTCFERIKETVNQAVEVARESGRVVDMGAGGVDVDLEQLPAYEEAMGAGAGGGGAGRILRPVPLGGNGVANGVGGRAGADGGACEANARPAEGSAGGMGLPDEPPPGYEEAQGGVEKGR